MPVYYGLLLGVGETLDPWLVKAEGETYKYVPSCTLFICISAGRSNSIRTVLLHHSRYCAHILYVHPMLCFQHVMHVGRSIQHPITEVILQCGVTGIWILYAWEIAYFIDSASRRHNIRAQYVHTLTYQACCEDETGWMNNFALHRSDWSILGYTYYSEDSTPRTGRYFLHRDQSSKRHNSHRLCIYIPASKDRHWVIPSFNQYILYEKQKKLTIELILFIRS